MTSPKRSRLWPRLERLLLAALNLTILPLSRLARRRPKHWVFGHQFGEFAGNPKYLFLWMAQNRPDYTVTWISGRAETRRLLASRGYRAVRRWSPAGMRAALSAKVFVYAHGADDVHLQLSGNALLLNLWHGVGLKATALGDEGGVVARNWRHRDHPLKRAWYLPHVTMPGLLVTTSPFMQQHFAGQFALPAERCPILGYPRLDPACDERLRAAAAAFDPCYGAQLDNGGFAEVYLYMPTFRDSGRDFLEEALPDLARLQAVLKARNAILYLKLHPRTAPRPLAATPNIRVWPRDADVYAHLHRVDLLVTDYSSILYDALCASEAGIILYTFDRARYEASDRPLLYPFDENVAGVEVATFEELIEVIADGTALRRPSGGQAEMVRVRFWGPPSGAAAPRIVDYVERMLAAPAGLRAT